MSSNYAPYGEEEAYEDDDDYFVQQTHGNDWAKQAWSTSSNHHLESED